MISRQRHPECLPDLSLDQLLSHELPPALERAAQTHLAECSSCSARHAELVAERANFAEQMPTLDALLGPRAESLGKPARPRSSRTWLNLALSAAAVLALGVGLGRLLEDERGRDPIATRGEPDTRTKGSGVAFGFVVRRGGNTLAGDAAQVLHPGDVLRFTLSSARPVYAGVWGIDALGRPSLYQAQPELSLVQAGQRQALPEAVELDESLGEEHLVLVYCETAAPTLAITSALGASPEAPQLPAGCNRESLGIRKALP